MISDGSRNWGGFFVFSTRRTRGTCHLASRRRQFVKYAGARTIEYAGRPEDAVDRLKRAVPVYQDLQHPSLISLVDHGEAGPGYVVVFEWFDGESLHPHWKFPPPHKYTDPHSPYRRFRQLPVERRLAALETIFQFHVHVEARQYAAIDFYDGSLLYNFSSHAVKICDIDFYTPKPLINTAGRLWGSSRFMSPEEFELGAAIDARTNVFTMGASAFALLGAEEDRSFSRWEAGTAFYDVALRAVEQDRMKRFSSVGAFYRAWTVARQRDGV